MGEKNRVKKNERTVPTERRSTGLAVGVQFPKTTEEELNISLEELERLVSTLGATVVEKFIQKRTRPESATFIGTGKAEEIGLRAKELECEFVAFDDELTGTQLKNLEKIMKCKVMDRTSIILDIFSRHARTKEAKVQVELAMLEYLSTHLTRRWTHLERQKGGIGLKGVGEKQIELDRRMIRSKISLLKKDLEHMARERATQRLHRDKFLRVAIVGYTNAGKSTLMNALTDSEVFVDDRVFATLDPTVRVIDPKTRPPILLSDTVGFISKLPHDLVASFRSTLQEVLEADMLLHVVDLSAVNFNDQMEVTKAVLDEIGAGDKPSVLVFNKADLVKEAFLPKVLERRYFDSAVVSSFRPEDMKKLRNVIYAFFERAMIDLEVTIPYTNSWLQSQIHEYAKVMKKEYLEEGTRFQIRIMKASADWLKIADDSKTIV